MYPAQRAAPARGVGRNRAGWREWRLLWGAPRTATGSEITRDGGCVAGRRTGRGILLYAAGGHRTGTQRLAHLRSSTQGRSRNPAADNANREAALIVPNLIAAKPVTN